MMPDPRHGFVWTLVLCVLVFTSAGALSPEKSRGIAPEDLKHYQSDPIWCKDKSKSFPASRLNDDFCDCADGTDEPGTSACPEGKFYCKNVGHTPQYLFSSRVNDGICDCCDGSDEYNSKTVCPNTCWEAGKKLRDKLEKKVSTFREGSRIRANDIEYAKKHKPEEEAELALLKKEEKSLKDVTQRLKVKLDAVEEAEKLERQKKAKEEEERKKAEAALNETKAAEAAVEEKERMKEKQEDVNDEQLTNKQEETEEVPVVVPEIKIPQDEQSTDKKEETEEGPVDVPEIKVPQAVEDRSTDHEKTEENTITDVSEMDQERSIEDAHENVHGDVNQESESLEGLSKDEVGRRVASRWVKDAETETDQVEDEYKELDEQYSPEPDEDDDAPDSYEYDNYSPPTDVSYTEEAQEVTWWSKIRQIPRTVSKFLGLKPAPVDISEAERIRTDYYDSRSKLNQLSQNISELENKLKLDFGKELEFYSLYGKCYEKEQQKYVYKVCLYKDATQLEDRSSTRLGTWEGFEDDHRTVKFGQGDNCWNGPQRSLTLKLKCGMKTELSEIEEPSRCEYSASLWTPAVCFEHRAKELQEQLDALRAGAGSPQHEEL